jgi:hypothetical protein
MTNETLSLLITHSDDATQRNRICQGWNCDDVGVRQLTFPPVCWRRGEVGESTTMIEATIKEGEQLELKCRGVSISCYRHYIASYHIATNSHS